MKNTGIIVAFIGTVLVFTYAISTVATGEETSVERPRFILPNFIPSEYSLTHTSVRAVVAQAKHDPNLLIWSCPGRAYQIETKLLLQGLPLLLKTRAGGLLTFAGPRPLKVRGRSIDMEDEKILPLVWFDGAEHVFHGKVLLREICTIESDTSYPLSFKIVEQHHGYVYLCGRGSVTTKDGKTYALDT